MSEDLQILEDVTNKEYEYGFYTDIESDKAPKGLNEDIIRLISKKKNEPEWMLEYRLRAFRTWLKMAEPRWPNVDFAAIDYQDIHYYAAPKKKPSLESLDEVDPELLKTLEKLGISTDEQKVLTGVAVDVVWDSTSVVTTFKKSLAEKGVLFMSFGEAVQEHPELVKKYLGTVVPYNDNFFAALNAAVFTDGSFVYIPKGVRCPMELSTYFRINEANTGQFERTLIIADEGSYVSYLEGCTAPQRDENQLHAAVVELVAMDDAEIKYSTRGNCLGKNSKISWTQVETGSSVTWKYPSCYLTGDNSVEGAENARNFSQCDSMLLGDRCGAHTFPYIEVNNNSAQVEHEATTSKIGEDQIFYCNQRGIDTETAIGLIVNGFAKEVMQKLPMEFAVEAQKLLAISLEGSVG
ncbi:UNVERIFIED_CONTAM: hypothetical protein GTU68_029124 [Idotea baltica]|nr:hypothetical protein [Idotea baltica]